MERLALCSSSTRVATRSLVDVRVGLPRGFLGVFNGFSCNQRGSSVTLPYDLLGMLGRTVCKTMPIVIFIMEPMEALKRCRTRTTAVRCFRRTNTFGGSGSLDIFYQGNECPTVPDDRWSAFRALASNRRPAQCYPGNPRGVSGCTAANWDSRPDFSQNNNCCSPRRCFADMWSVDS